MAALYPRRQTFIIAVICILAVVGVAIYVYSGRLSNSQESAALVAENSASDKENLIVANTGTISSSTEDWKNAFYSTGTSTRSKKTGTTVINGEVLANEGGANGTMTVTDNFSKNFFARYMILQSNNQLTDQTAIKDVVDQSVNDLATIIPKPTFYGLNDITVSKSAGVTAEKNYANAVGSVLSNYTPTEDPLIAANQAVEKQDPRLLASVNKIVSQYSDMVHELLKINPPQSMVGLHINLINSASSMLYVSQGMTKVFVDPAQGLIALKYYTPAYQTFFTAATNIRDFLNGEKIVFLKSEPGAIFNLIQ